mmetsp:Transcript_4987/g.10486  ORF Transcript_4987/g.10486 Transcript_4987/m.10486 type:complete len:243 (+) Transcript_4987:556-1284(+)
MEFCNNRITDYLVRMFIALQRRQRRIEVCHDCFLKQRPVQRFWEKSGHCGLHASTSKYDGCLLFKEFGMMVDSNTIDIQGRRSMDVHGLGQKKGLGAPFHCVIAPEVKERICFGRVNPVATPILECCKPSTCQPRFENRFHRQFLRGIAVDHYLPDFTPDRKKRKWHIEILNVDELLDTNGIGYLESKLPSFQIKQGDNDVTWDEIESSVILDEHHYQNYQGQNTKLDVTFVLGKFAGKEVK